MMLRTIVRTVPNCILLLTLASSPSMAKDAPNASLGDAGKTAGPTTPIEVPSTLLLSLPPGDPPETGWPVMLLMHGYGVNKEDFDELIAVVSDRGLATFSIDAPNEIGGGRRSWGPATSTATTHQYVQSQLENLREDPRFDFSTIHVGGFSQGGIQSIMLSLRYPEIYGGILSVSPAGGEFPAEWDPGKTRHPLFLIAGDQENAGILGSVKRASDLWKASGEAVRMHRHPGGHHFPSDWVQIMGDAVTWIQNESGS